MRILVPATVATLMFLLGLHTMAYGQTGNDQKVNDLEDRVQQLERETAVLKERIEYLERGQHSDRNDRRVRQPRSTITVRPERSLYPIEVRTDRRFGRERHTGRFSDRRDNRNCVWESHDRDSRWDSGRRDYGDRRDRNRISYDDDRDYRRRDRRDRRYRH
ncbi:MAG: hypothetical protein WDZ82_01070 [Candidatus Paceibacterota bacterium]